MVNKLFMFLFLLTVTFVSNTLADDLYVEANVERIEICTSGELILLFLSNASGSIPAYGNGCSNSGNYSLVKISNSLAEFESKNGMLSMALVAYSSGKRLRIRYDEVTSKVNSIALL